MNTVILLALSFAAQIAFAASVLQYGYWDKLATAPGTAKTRRNRWAFASFVLAGIALVSAYSA